MKIVANGVVNLAIPPFYISEGALSSRQSFTLVHALLLSQRRGTQRPVS